VNDVLGMEIGRCVGHLIDVDGAASFREATILRELLVKLALAGKFEHEEVALFVVEVTVETETFRCQRFCRISISRRICFSTRDWTISDL
jgi:hypothetical protein